MDNYTKLARELRELRNQNDNRRWALDVACYARNLKMLETFKNPAIRKSILEQQKRLEERWPGKRLG